VRIVPDTFRAFCFSAEISTGLYGIIHYPAIHDWREALVIAEAGIFVSSGAGYAIFFPEIRIWKPAGK